MKTRAKFSCVEIKEFDSDCRATIKLTPVYSGSEENRQFYAWTPTGSIILGVLSADHGFKCGYDYYVDFTQAPELS